MKNNPMMCEKPRVAICGLKMCLRRPSGYVSSCIQIDKYLQGRCAVVDLASSDTRELCAHAFACKTATSCNRWGKDRRTAAAIRSGGQLDRRTHEHDACARFLRTLGNQNDGQKMYQSGCPMLTE